MTDKQMKALRQAFVTYGAMVRYYELNKGTPNFKMEVYRDYLERTDEHLKQAGLPSMRELFHSSLGPISRL